MSDKWLAVAIVGLILVALIVAGARPETIVDAVPDVLPLWIERR